MRLTLQKRIASDVLGCSSKRVWISPERVQEVKEAITKEDIRTLINNGLIVKMQKKGHSKVRSRMIAEQKRKGRRKGKGSRKGAQNARTPRKQKWVHTIRVQRSFLKSLKLKQLIPQNIYKDLMLKCKGGFFRSVKHIKIYITERGLVQKK